MNDAPRKRNAVVIGAGVAGLASAALLAGDGWSVDLIEQRATFGGRVAVWEHDGFRFDLGPSWYLMPEVYDHFFRLLGTTAAAELDLVRLDPAYRVFFEHSEAPLELRDGFAANVAAFEAVEPGAGAALEKYVDSAFEIYVLALQQFLYGTFESRSALINRDVLRHGPRLGKLLTRSLESFIAAQFDDRRLQQVLGYPAVFLGTSPDRAPALYHLMSWLDLAEGVYHPRGGFGTMIEAMLRVARRTGVRTHASTRATAVDVDRSGPRPAVRGVRVVDATGTAAFLHADLVVGAADLHHVETQLVPADLRTYDQKWWASRDPGPGAVLACLGVRGELPQLAHHTLFFTDDWQQNFDDIFESPTRVPDPASAYVCRPTATDAAAAPPGHENVFVLVPVPADTDIGAGGIDGGGDPMVEKVADAAIEHVAVKAGIPDLSDRVVVRRTIGPADFSADFNAWSGGALGPAHVLKQSAFFRAGNASKRIDGLLYAGAGTIPGVGVPMCLISAELVLKRVRGDTSTARLPERVAPTVLPE